MKHIIYNITKSDALKRLDVLKDSIICLLDNGSIYADVYKEILPTFMTNGMWETASCWTG